MRALLMFLPLALLAQTMLSQTMLAQTPPPPKAAATPAATPAAPKTAAPGRGAPGRGAAGRGATAVKPAAPKPVVPPPLATDDEKTIYALGLNIARSLAPFDLSPAELDILKRAFTDAAANKPAISLDEWGPKIDPMVRARGGRAAEKEKAASAAYLAKAATEPGAIKTESGMIIKELKAGTGDSPKATDTVKVHYRGTLVNGTEFDSSYKRNEPTSFALNGVIPCWTEGVQRMKPGGKSMLICPSNLAYGDQGRPSIPGGATLIFEIELLEVGGK